MANLLYSLRGNSLTPRHSSSAWSSSLSPINTAASQVNSAGTGIISGGYIDLDQGSYTDNGLLIPAQGNVSTGNKISVLWRGSLSTTASSQSLIFVGGPNLLGTIRVHFLSGNTIGVNVVSYTGSTILNSTASWTPVVGTIYDVCLVADLSVLTANSVKVYVDNSIQVQGTLSATFSSPRNINALQVGLGIQSTSGLTSCQQKIDEFVIWDDLITPGSVTLNSGTGALNGVLRTSLVAATAFDASSNTDPGIANVRSTTSYVVAGITQTGTSVIPVAADVRFGTSVDHTTGLIHVPAANQVLTGIPVDQTTGTLVVTPPTQSMKHILQLNSSNQLYGPLWVDSAGSIVTGASLGTGAYTIYNPDGTTTGINQSGISAAASGLFQITPVSVTSLIGSVQYIVKVEITVDSVLLSDFIPLIIDNTLSKVNSNVNFITALSV